MRPRLGGLFSRAVGGVVAPVRPRLDRLGAFLDPAQIHLDDDVEDDRATCAACPAPASERVLTGWRSTVSPVVAQAVFEWLCDDCAARRARPVRVLPVGSRFPRSDRTVDEL